MFSDRVKPTKEEVALMDKRRDQSLLGEKVYILWGGQDEGYEAIVIAEDERQLCFQSDKKGLELIPRVQRDNTFFDNKEEAFKSRNLRKEDWNRRKEKYENYKKQWEKKQEIA